MKKSLGPVSLNLGRRRLFEFYKDAARDNFDVIYIGEVSCPERGAGSKDLLLDIAHLIKDSGRNLFISSYAMVTQVKQIEDIEDLLQLADGLELNNIAFLELGFDKILVAGPFLNIYNCQSANYIAKLGFKRVVLPMDLTWDSIIDIARNSNLETEVIAGGRKTLAISRRCYSLRALGLDDCNMDCFAHPEGLSLGTLFRINGKQILSEKYYSLNEKSPLLDRAGISVLRFEYGSFK